MFSAAVRARVRCRAFFAAPAERAAGDVLETRQDTVLDRRSASTVALGASAAVVLVAILFLMMAVGAEPAEPELAPGELQRAISAGQVRERPPPSPPRIPPPRTPSSSAGAAARSAPSGTPPSLPSSESPSAPASAPPSAPAPPSDNPDAPTPEQEAAMQEATRFYDRGDYESARAAAIDAMAMNPGPGGKERMLRVAASASCFMGEPDQARKHYDQLTPRGQRDIAKRCRRMGIEF
jgi:hypothetical protein